MLYRCNYCGERFCPDHHLPEYHKCKGLPPRSWSAYAGGRGKREPIREPPWVTIPVKYPMTKVKRPFKIRGVVKSIATGVVVVVVAVAIVWGTVTIGPVIWERIQEFLSGTQVETLPPDYYGAARNYVTANYVPVGEKNVGDLASFLDQIELRDYVEDIFDCSEATSMLEWLLEGAGFSVSIASKSSYVSILSHTWVLVTLDSGDFVAIEATSLTQNYYAPPGIIEAPDGRFREYTYGYKMFLEWKKEYPPSSYDYDPNITFEEWEEEYLTQSLLQSIGIPSHETYYNPPKIYASPEDATKPQSHDGVSYYHPISEWDWWNAPPYNAMDPFASWD